MIIADTSVWAHHIRKATLDFLEHLNTDQVLMHSWVVGELALGDLPHRDVFLKYLRALPPAAEARDEEVMEMIRINHLHGCGIGWVDAHLIASARLSNAALWTRDKRLFAVSQSLGIPTAGLH